MAAKFEGKKENSKSHEDRENTRWQDFHIQVARNIPRDMSSQAS